MVQFFILSCVRRGIGGLCRFSFIAFLSLNYSYSQPLRATPESVDYDQGGEFNFVRVRFDTYYSSGFRGGPWAIDFHDAYRNFLRGVSLLTNVRVMPPLLMSWAALQSCCAHMLRTRRTQHAAKYAGCYQFGERRVVV